MKHRTNTYMWSEYYCMCPYSQININTVSSFSAVAWDPETSLSTSLEVERPPNVRLQGAFQHNNNIINISVSTPFCFSFFFSWRILKIPKTARVTSPICQALRSARSLRHFSCFFSLSVNFPFFLRGQWALSSCQHTGNEDQKKMSSHLVLKFLKMLSLLLTPLLCICHGLPSSGRWML